MSYRLSKKEIDELLAAEDSDDESSLVDSNNDVEDGMDSNSDDPANDSDDSENDDDNEQIGPVANGIL